MIYVRIYAHEIHQQQFECGCYMYIYSDKYMYTYMLAHICIYVYKYANIYIYIET